MKTIVKTLILILHTILLIVFTPLFLLATGMKWICNKVTDFAERNWIWYHNKFDKK